MAQGALCHDRPLIARAGAVASSNALPTIRNLTGAPQQVGLPFPIENYALQTIDRVTHPPSSHLPVSSLPHNHHPPPTKNINLRGVCPKQTIRLQSLSLAAIDQSPCPLAYFLPAYPSLTRVISTKAASLRGISTWDSTILPGSTAERPLRRPINYSQTPRFFTTVKP